MNAATPAASALLDSPRSQIPCVERAPPPVWLHNPRA